MLLYPMKDKQFSNLLPTPNLPKHYKPKPGKHVTNYQGKLSVSNSFSSFMIPISVGPTQPTIACVTGARSPGVF